MTNSILNKRSVGLGLILVGLVGLISLSLCEANDESERSSQLTARARLTLPQMFDFKQYKAVFHKHYSSLLEEAARARLFLGRAFSAFVSVINYKRHRTSSYLAINQMSDWTPEEIRSTYSRRPAQASANEQVKEPLPAVSLDEVKREFGEIAELGGRQAGLRLLIAEELRKPGERRVRRQVQSVGDLDMSEAFTEQLDTSDEPGQRVESDNELPRPVNSDSSDGQPGEPLRSTPGENYMSWVLDKASQLWPAGGSEGEVKVGETAPSLPDEMFIDHRDCLLEIRSQGNCGACYAFATIAVYEWLYCKATGNKVALSEQYLIDCGQGFGMNGCSGGYIQLTPDFVSRRGLELLASYPYRGQTGQCPYFPSTPESSMGALRVSTDSFQLVHVDNLEEELKRGPMMISFHPNEKFPQYGGGVDDDVGCDTTYAHAMTLVGSGREDNKEYWLIRNSWSTLWGEQGYYKLNKKASRTCIEDGLAYQITGFKVQNKVLNRYRK